MIMGTAVFVDVPLLPKMMFEARRENIAIRITAFGAPINRVAFLAEGWLNDLFLKLMLLDVEFLGATRAIMPVIGLVVEIFFRRLVAMRGGRLRGIGERRAARLG